MTKRRLADPWLFRRLVRMGVLDATMPVYVFSEAAAEEVAVLNGRVESTKWGALAVMPHDVFGVEMTVRAPDDQGGVRFRTLTAATRSPEQIPAQLAAKGATCTLNEFQSLAMPGGGSLCVWLPPMWIDDGGLVMAMPHGADSLKALKEAARLQQEVVETMLDRTAKHAETFRVCDWRDEDDPVAAYNRRAGEVGSFLRTACAVMASPALKTESGVSPCKIPWKKGGNGRAETRWTYVDVDIDRIEAERGEEDGEPSRHGVALHPVRQHLRVTRYGIGAVRAHMRGDARYGVRHRIGSVNRSGE